MGDENEAEVMVELPPQDEEELQADVGPKQPPKKKQRKVTGGLTS